MNPRLVVNCATNSLKPFEQVAQATITVAGEYDVRLVASHLARRTLHQWRDGDGTRRAA